MASSLLRKATVGAGLALGTAFVYHQVRGTQEYRDRSDLTHMTPTYRPHLHNMPTREEQIKALQEREYDILVIGGGATGCGVALDAASRGLRTALVERQDFSSGTSGKSTKLIHGGVRYLEKAFLNLDYGQFQLVKEALSERSNLLKISPHLSEELPIMLPIYKLWQLPYYWAGAKVYDYLAGRKGLESSYFLSRGKALEKFPMLKQDRLVGAMVYYDAQHNDARMNVALALTAASEGAALTNYTEVLELSKDADTGKVNGAIVLDRISNKKLKIRAKVVVNATGPYADAVRKMANESVEPIVSPSSGVHIVLPSYYSPRDMGLLDPATSDGRVIFFLPWEGSTIAGTTDAPCELSFTPKPDHNEIDFILSEVSSYLSKDVQVRREDVLAAWSGIRPLVRDPSKEKTEGLCRNHIVHVSDEGLLTVSGGKWTTYRQMAEDTVDMAVKSFDLKPKHKNSRTEEIFLVGAHDYYPNMYIQLIQEYGLDVGVAKHLAKTYGDRAVDVADLTQETGQRWPMRGIKLSQNYVYVEAEVLYAVREEYAVTAVDVLARRTRLACLNAAAARDCLPRVIELMAKELNWSKARRQTEFTQAEAFITGEMGLSQLGPKRGQPSRPIGKKKETATSYYGLRSTRRSGGGL
mmetsp:Transcript_40454/g.101814  ORF Transcript_40454/g.101814 Transcript_40454/m.101814 type:complete len:639 (+) Transcript_40454:203-2119(+)